MKLLAVCLGRPEKLPGKSYKTGINKSAINAAVMVDKLGLVGDAVCNDRHHGGQDQAVLLEGSLTLDWWATELGQALPHGSFGENLIIEGLDGRDIAVGDRFHVGDVLLEATSARIPCNTLAAKVGNPAFAKTYLQGGRPGIYCRVVTPGFVAPGQPVRVEPYRHDRVPIAEILAVYGRKLTAAQKDRYLAAPIATRLRAMITKQD